MSSNDILNQLERLNDLRKKGVINDNEFQTQKAKLLLVLDSSNNNIQKISGVKNYENKTKSKSSNGIFIVIALIVFFIVFFIPFVIVALTWLPDWISPEGVNNN